MTLPMTPNGIFTVGFEKHEIEAIQKKAKSFLLAGKVMMSYSDGGSSASKQFSMPVNEVLMECAFALKKLSGKQKRILYTDYRAFRYT